MPGETGKSIEYPRCGLSALSTLHEKYERSQSRDNRNPVDGAITSRRRDRRRGTPRTGARPHAGTCFDRGPRSVECFSRRLRAGQTGIDGKSSRTGRSSIDTRTRNTGRHPEILIIRSGRRAPVKAALPRAKSESPGRNDKTDSRVAHSEQASHRKNPIYENQSISHHSFGMRTSLRGHRLDERLQAGAR